jgi:hypothetical protein
MRKKPTCGYLAEGVRMREQGSFIVNRRRTKAREEACAISLFEPACSWRLALSRSWPWFSPM